jgi:hypothetical protein
LPCHLELSTFNFAPPLTFFRIFLHWKLTTDNLKLPKHDWSTQRCDHKARESWRRGEGH